MRLLLLSIMLMIFTASYGEDNIMLFNNFTIQDGLPTNNIMEVAQDTSGFLWVATELGIARFDGENFHNYSHVPRDTFSIPSNLIRKLYLSSSGDLWIGTWNGLCKYDPVYDRFQRFIPNPLLTTGNPLNIIISIDEAVDGTIYFLTEGGYLYSIKNGVIKTELNLQQGNCKFMLIDRENRCWISSRNTVFRFNINTNFTTQFEIGYPPNVKDPEITDMILVDSFLYISSYNSDLIRYNFHSNQQFRYDLVDDLSHTTTLLKEENMLYIGTSDGLKILDISTGQIRSYSEDLLNSKSLSSNSVIDVFRDRQGNLWIGTVKGLNVAYRNKGFFTYSKYNSETEKDLDVRAIYKDDQNHLWLGMSNGFEILDENNNKLHSLPGKEQLQPSSQIGEVFCIYEDSKENIWIGTYVNGLIKYNTRKDKLTQYYPGEGVRDLPGTDVRAIKEDDKGNIWIAIHGKGIYVQKEGEEKFEVITKVIPDIPRVFNQTWAFDIDFDEEYNLWMASSLGAYYYNFTTRNYHHFNQSQSSLHFLSANSISTVFIDSQGNIWMGSKNGLNFLSSDFTELKIFDQNNGLLNNEIQAINEDNNRIIWVSTNNGIARFQPSERYEFNITNYDMNHGLNTNDFSLHSTFFSEDGMMYFGGFFGYTYFEPEIIKIDSIPPKIVLTDLFVFDKRVEVRKREENKEKDDFYLDKHIRYTDLIRIKQKYSMIGFEFVALDFLNPEKNRYQYKLEGFDDEWRDIGTRNIVYFNSLRPGNYTFKVKGANSYGIWNPEPAGVELKIIPPFWKSNYALILYFLMIVAISLYLIKISVEKAKMRIQVEQQDRLRDLRTRFFMNVSHELKTPLTLISVPLKNIMRRHQENKAQPSVEELNMISRNVDRLIRIMNQLFDFRKIELNKTDMKIAKLGIKNLTSNILDFFSYQFKQKNIKLVTDFPADEIEFYFDRDKMDKIFFNLISNALKYSPDDSEINIEIKQVRKKNLKKTNSDFVQWIIRDNGRGIPDSRIKNIFDRFSYSNVKGSGNQGGTGIGLSIVKEFVSLHNGNITIQSQASKDGYEERYTKVIVEFPLDENLYNAEQKVEIQENNKMVYDSRMKADTHQQNQLNNFGDDDRSSETGSAYSVLVIDDDKDICSILKAELLSKYKVFTAFDGNEGMKKALNHVPDIIISDIMMPGKDGFELCRELKTNIETSHIPVILLTGKTADEDEMEGYSKGADAYISKPFDLSKLMARIDSLITNRIQLKRNFLSSYGIELKKVVPTNTDEKFIQAFLKIIHENISDHNLNVDIIIRELGMSRSLLYKKLNSIANTSVNVFIRKVRLKKATELLVEGNMNITEVAYAVGFDSLPYFSKCFQEEFGVSPSKYVGKEVGL